jgi:hypothetical protein
MSSHREAGGMMKRGHGEAVSSAVQPDLSTKVFV